MLQEYVTNAGIFVMFLMYLFASFAFYLFIFYLFCLALVCFPKTLKEMKMYTIIHNHSYLFNLQLRCSWAPRRRSSLGSGALFPTSLTAPF